MRKTCIILFALFCSLAALSTSLAAQTVTLVPPRDPVTGKYDEGKSCFSFKYGLAKEITKGRWDLGYGFLSISDQDWFTLNPTSNENCSVIRDLGKLDWKGPFTVPVLEPLPELPKGKWREITIDSSA